MNDDINRLKDKISRLENELTEERQRNAFSNAILESGNLIIWSVDTEFNLLSFNQNYFKYFLPYASNKAIGYELDDQIKKAKGKSFWDRQYKKILTGCSANFGVRIKAGDKYEWKEVFLNPVYNDVAKIIAISGVAYDITEKAESRYKLIQSEEKFRNIFESFQDLYFRTDFKANITMLSPSVYDIMGYKEDELISKNATNYYIYNIKIKSLLRQLVLNGSVRNFEIGIVHKSGHVIPCICNIRIIYIKGRPSYIEGVARDITELKRTNEQLQMSKDLAERSLKIKERFLANMSHEIKTPLNGIMGMLHLLDGSNLTKAQQKHLRTLKSSSEILMNVLNDLLDISKIEAGKMELKNSIVNVKNLFDQLKTLYAMEAKRNGLKLTFAIDKEIPENILADEIKLLQIFSNLISNAIKFTPKGGVVAVSLTTTKNKRNSAIKLLGQVADTGIGISNKDTKKIFKSFTQLDSSSSKTYKGTGLGLFISKKLSKMMGGDIGAKPNYPKGTIFWFTFDTIRVSALAEVKNIGIIRMTTSPEVMVVDDNKVNLQLASEILVRAGCQVTMANSGQNAVHLAQETKFKLILMDIQMPDMDGLESTEYIRISGKNIQTPIVAMTAYSMKGDKDKFLEAGMDDYISKPIVPEQLLMAVKKWTEDSSIVLNIEEQKNKTIEKQTLNLTVLQKLEDFGGREMVQEALNELDEECDEQLLKCKDLFESKNFEEILNILHTLKGNAGTLGAEKIAYWAEFLEDEVKRKNYPIFESSLIEINQLHKEFKEALKQFN